MGGHRPHFVPEGAGNRRCVDLMDAELRRKERRISQLLAENSRLAEEKQSKSVHNEEWYIKKLKEARAERDKLRELVEIGSYNPVFRTPHASATHRLWHITFENPDRETITLAREVYETLVKGNEEMAKKLAKLHNVMEGCDG